MYHTVPKVNLDAFASLWFDAVMKDLNPETVAAWTTLLTISRTLLEQVESDLKQSGFPPLSWYDALLEIEATGAEGIRPYELKDKLLLPQYGTSRLLDRLAKAGLIERMSCEDDRRGHTLQITDAGRKMRREMWPVYSTALRRNVETRLGAEETVQLTSLLEKLRIQ